MNPEFTISILTYTALPMARKCIESVLKAGGDFELILTDNGGTPEVGKAFDDLARYISRTHPITVFHNKTNEGFIAPNRRAFKQARGRFFVLLNDDTVVTKGWLDLLRAPFMVDQRCAISGPAGGCTQLRGDFHGEIGQRFEYLEGAMMCLDREKILAVEPNLFPEELVGAYGEDSYISLRMREAGYNLHRVALPFVHHRCITSAVVPQCREWQLANHRFLHERFKRYMMGHTFGYPTIVKRNAAWGDVLLTTPIIRALKKLRPMSPIWVESSACPEIFNGNPDVAHVSRTPIPQPQAHVMVNLNGISEMHPQIPILKSYVECAEVELNGEVTALYPPGGDIEWAKRTIPNSGWIAIHPGPSSWRCKMWPFERWKEVIKALREECWKVVLVGNDRLPPIEADLDIRAQTNIGQLAALLGEVELFVGIDSFPIHAAQAMKTPVVGLFGITTAANILTGGSRWIAVESDPKHPGTGLRHRMIGKTHVDYPDNPMETITIDQVLSGIGQLTDELTTP